MKPSRFTERNPLLGWAMQQAKWRQDFLNIFLAIQDPMHLRKCKDMLVILPKVVSEHFMLKETLGKQETLTDTDSSAYANQKKTVFTALRPT